MIEKSVPRDHRLSSLDKPRGAKRRSLGWILLFYPHTHDIFFQVLSTALAKHHANGDTSMVTEIVNLCPIM